MTQEFIVRISLENDAFEGDPLPDIRRILQDLIDDSYNYEVKHLNNYKNLKDINGNTVGQFAIKHNVKITYDY